MNTASPLDELSAPQIGPGLTLKDARFLHETLVQGEGALARRKDLGDMFKRIVAMMTTLDTGLGERQQARADEDRALLSDRMDRLERSVNGIEGVLRIEMEPMIRRTMEQASVGPYPAGWGRRKAGWPARAAYLVMLGLCVVGGAIFSDEINSFGTALQDATFWPAVETDQIQSPNGGIAAPTNQVN